MFVHVECDVKLETRIKSLFKKKNCIREIHIALLKWVRVDMGFKPGTAG